MSFNITSLSNPILPEACMLTALPYIPILDTSAAVASCWKEVNKAIQMISACPFSKSFWGEVHEEGKFSIQCLPAEVLKHPARVYTDDREIQMSTFQYPILTKIVPTSMVYNILFELNNLKQGRMLSDVHHRACSTNAVDYSKSVEAIEYITGKNTNNLFRKCVEQRFWTPEEFPETYAYRDMLSEKENFNMQARSGHVSSYQLGWYRRCDAEGVRSFKFLLAQLESQGVLLPYNFYADNELNTLEELNPFNWERQINQKRQIEKQETCAADEFPQAGILEEASHPDIDLKSDQDIEETSQDWWSQVKDAIARYLFV